jgi:hypothetical protein
MHGLSIFNFTFVPDPNPLTTHWLMRAQASLYLDIAANEVARNLSTKGPFKAVVSSGDRFDARTSSISFTLSLVSTRPTGPEAMLRSFMEAQRAANSGKAVGRRGGFQQQFFGSASNQHRAKLFFCRGGTLVAEFGGSEKTFAAVDRDYEALLEHLSFVANEGPSSLDRISLISGNSSWQLAGYALGGILCGLVGAGYRNRRRLGILGKS